MGNMSFTECTIGGYLSEKPVPRETPQGLTITIPIIVSYERFSKVEGKMIEYSFLVECLAMGPICEAHARNLDKGQYVIAFGKFYKKKNKFNSKAGTPVIQHIFKVILKDLIYGQKSGNTKPALAKPIIPMYRSGKKDDNQSY